MSGAGFTNGTRTFLAKDTARIKGKAVSVIHSTRISCTFRIPVTAATGKWDVLVTDADGHSGILEKAFRVKT